ncbi:MAG: DUF4351 domain-containing protein [Methylococcales bacterium]|nr:DUF4351 domain-containing protein [Methylococcales bacterium]
MAYVTSVERIGIEKGRIEGLQQGLQQGQQLVERLLVHRFGLLPEAVRQRLSTATLEQLERWSLKILDAKILDDVFIDN